MSNAGQGTRGLSGSDWTRMKRLIGARNNNSQPTTTTSNALTTVGTNTTAGNGVMGYVTSSTPLTVLSTTSPSTITLNANTTLLTNGQPIVFSNTFAGLTSGTTYYVSGFVSGTATFSVATSVANAIAATPTVLTTITTSVGTGIISFPVTVLYTTSTNIYLTSVSGIYGTNSSSADKITFATAFSGVSASTPYSIYSVTSGTPGYITLAQTASPGTQLTSWTASSTAGGANVGVYGINLTSGGALTDAVQSTNLSVGQSVIFHSTAGGVTAGNVYFIKTLGTIPTTTITFATTPTGTGITLTVANTATVFPSDTVVYTYTGTTTSNTIVGQTDYTASLIPGQPIVFSAVATGGGVTTNTVYFVRTVTATQLTLASDSLFATPVTISSGVNGTFTFYKPTLSYAVTGFNTTNRIVMTSTAGLSVGQPIIFNRSPGASGGITAGTTYYIQTISANAYIIVASDVALTTPVSPTGSPQSAVFYGVGCVSMSIASSTGGTLTLSAAHPTLALNQAIIPYAAPTGLALGVPFFINTAPTGTSVVLSLTYGGTTMSSVSGSGSAFAVTANSFGAAYSQTSNSILLTTPTSLAIGQPVVFNTAFSGLTAAATGISNKYFISSVNTNTITISTGAGTVGPGGPISTITTVIAGTSTGTVSLPAQTVTGISDSALTLSTSAAFSSYTTVPTGSSFTLSVLTGGLAISTPYTINSVSSTAITLSLSATGGALFYPAYNPIYSQSSLALDDGRSLSLFVTFNAAPVQTATVGSGTYQGVTDKVLLSFGIQNTSGNNITSINVDLQSGSSLVYLQISGGSPVTTTTTVAIGDVLGFVILGKSIVFYKNGLPFYTLKNSVNSGNYFFFSNLNNLGRLSTSQNFGVSFSQITYDGIINPNADISPQMAAQLPYNPSMLIKAVVGTGKIRRPASNWTDYVASQKGDFVTNSQNTGADGTAQPGVTQTLTKLCDPYGNVYTPSKNILPSQFNRLKILS